MLTTEFAGSGTTPVVMKVIAARFVAPAPIVWYVTQSLPVALKYVPTDEAGIWGETPT